MLTVLLATHNGAHTLPRALESYCRIISPPGGWHCVIVDNGSTDSTKEIIRSFLGRLPLTYLFEPSKGKNAALNRGLALVQGDLIAFTDDDTLPKPDWLVEMRRAADEQTAFDVFGGVVLPHWEAPPPSWITEWVQLGPVFTLTDPAQGDGPVIPGYIYGTNMAVREKVFQAGYRYDAGIGPRQGQYAMGSETEFALRLDRAGHKSWFCKSAVVEHIIRKFQMERRWILERGTRYGRGRYRLYIQSENVGRKKLLGIPGYLWRELVKKGFDVAEAKLRGNSAELFRKRWIFNYLLGQAIEARAISKEPRASDHP